MKHSVLVVDDPSNLTLFARIVAQIDNCEAVPFGNSSLALSWVETNEVAMMVCDQNMPAPSGVELIHAFRSIRGRADTPVIMISGAIERDVKHQALAAGASAFLPKPVDPLEFLGIARNLVGAYRSRLDLIARNDALVDQIRSLNGRIEGMGIETAQSLLRTVGRADRALFDHMTSVAELSVAIAIAANVPKPEVDVLRIAARLYDVGKIAIPDRVIAKATPLTTQEREAVNVHPRIGHDILGGSSSRLLQAAAQIALSHHERMDGSGYPNGLKGDAIPLFGRIVAVADTYIAMRTERPRRTAFSPGMALEIIERSAGTEFDRRFVAALRATVLQPVTA